MRVSIDLVEYRPPRIAMFLLGVASIFHMLLPIRSFLIPSSAAVAAVLFLIGFAIMIFAWWQFKKRAIAICPTETTQHLITSGIYRYSRNPMYLGMSLMLAGIAAFAGAVPFYVATAAFFFAIDRVFCPFEEQKLSIEFGDGYDRYRSNVRRWI